MAYRQHVIRPAEHIDLADVQLVVFFQFHGVHHREQRLTVLFDFRPLMALQGILDGQFVQAEFLFHRCEFVRARVFERDPDEAFRARHIFADVFDRDVSELAAILAGRAIDQHGVNCLENGGRLRRRRCVPGYGWACAFEPMTGAMLRALRVVDVRELSQEPGWRPRHRATRCSSMR